MIPEMQDSHDGEKVSPSLEPLLHAVWLALEAEPLKLDVVKARLLSLLAFLCSPEGRTHANCVEVDRFLFLRRASASGSNGLPPSYRALLDDIGGNLHDAVESPEIASNFESTPEQLLVRVQNLA